MPQDGFADTIEDKGLSAQPSSGPQGAAGDSGGGSARAKSLIGRVLKGQYRLNSVLGQGAMGLVFRGTQSGLDKLVAIKIMSPDGFHTDESRDRFQREATVVSKLLHPSITQVLDFGIEGDMPFLVMEFVDGKELTDVLAQEGPMPPTRAVAIVRQLASALEEAHRHGVVHRDIKPQNLRLMRYTPGGQVFLKVLDFGIAKQLGEGSGQGQLTATGAVMGTPMYMAPEQAGGHKVSAAADQYAVGIVLYELLTGTVPFTGETLTGVLVSHLTKPPPPLPRQVPEVLQKVVLRLLAKSPAERFADMAELDRALAACEPACRDVPALSRGRVQSLVAGGAMAARPAPNRSLLLGGVAAGSAVVMLLAVIVLGPRLHERKLANQDHNRPTPPVAQNGVPVPPTAPTNPASNPTGDQTGTTPKLAVTSSPTPQPTPPEPPALPDKPIKPAIKTVTKGPATTPAKNAFDPETAEVKEKLNLAQKLLDDGEGREAIRVAQQVQSTGRFARAYRIMTRGSCLSTNIGDARMYFHQVASADRSKLISYCQEHGKDLK